MNVSVLIPVLNEASHIVDAIGRAWSAGAEEVVVCDGGSQDGTLELAERQRCRTLRSAAGRARQQNAAAAQATGDVLLFLHADNWLEAGKVQQIREVLRDPRVVGGAFQQRIEAPGMLYRLLERGNAARAGWLGLAYGDQGIFVRRTVFEQLGGFPDIPLMEDLRLMRALRRRGRLVLLPGPIHVSARRWQRYGVVRQTLRNWTLLAAEKCGVPPDRLARFYPPP